MTTEEVATAAGAMMTGVIGIARAMTTEEITTAHVTMKGETMNVLATMTEGTTGLCTTIALGYHPLIPQVCIPSRLTTLATKLVLMSFVPFLQSLGRLATFTPLLTAPLVVAVVSGSSVLPKKRTLRRLAPKWTVLASTAVKSVLFLPGTRDPWMSELLQVEPQVDLLPGAAAALLVAIDVALAPMKQGSRKYSSHTVMAHAYSRFLFLFFYVFH
jgi:hypothetical protein